MGIYAHKVIEIKSKEESTFNCYDQWIMNLGNTDGYNEGGLIQFTRDDIEKKIEEVKDLIKKGYFSININSGLGAEILPDENFVAILEALKTLEDIFVDMGDEDYVEYWCY